MTNVLSYSKEEAERLHNDKVTPIHLLLGILRHEGNKARKLLCQLDVNLNEVKQMLENMARKHQVLKSILTIMLQECCACVCLRHVLCTLTLLTPTISYWPF